MIKWKFVVKATLGIVAALSLAGGIAISTYLFALVLALNIAVIAGII